MTTTNLIPCYLDGLRGTMIDMPQEAIDALTAPGSCDAAAAYWAEQMADQLDAIGAKAIVEALIETGAWSREELEADPTLTRQRAVWVAAGYAEELEDAPEAPPELPRCLALETRYLGPTNYRGSRVTAKLLGRGERGKAVCRVVLDWCDDLSSEANHQRAAAESLRRWVETFKHPTRGELTSIAGTERGYIFTASTRSI